MQVEQRKHHSNNAKYQELVWVCLLLVVGVGDQKLNVVSLNMLEDWLLD